MSKDNIGAFYNLCYEDKFQHEDVENRQLFLNGEINQNTIDGIAYHIFRYNRLDKGIPVEERKPIFVYINSEGGVVSDGYCIIDAICTSKTPVYTVNIGLCASMGFLIYIAGKKRYSMPHSEFLMHDGSTMGFDSTAKMKDRMDFETGQLEKMNKDYITSHTKISEKLYKQKYRCEWYFLPAEGKDIGVVDYIVGEDCEIEEIV